MGRFLPDVVLRSGQILPNVTAQAATTYTAQAVDAGGLVKMTTTQMGGFRIPDFSVVPFPVGTMLAAYAPDAPSFYVQLAGTVAKLFTLDGVQNTDIAAPKQGAVMYARCVAQDVWTVWWDALPASFGTGGFSPPTLFLNAQAGDYFVPSALFGNITAITPQNIAPGMPRTLSVLLQQDATGGRTITWPANFKPIGNTPTQIALAANAKTLMMLTTFDGGTNWYYALGTV